MPPNSLAEWIVGQNIPRQRRESQRRDILRLEISTDDEYDTDTLLVTYPRTRRPRQAQPTPNDYGTKQVRFENQPQRSALKPTPSRRLMAAPFNDDDMEAVDAGSTTRGRSGRRKLTRRCDRRYILDSSDDEGDPNPHPTCTCPDCASGRRKLRKAGKWPKEARGASDEEEEPNRNSGKTGKKKHKSSSKRSKKGKKKTGTLNERDGNSGSESASADDSSASEDNALDGKKASSKKTKKRGGNKKTSKTQKEDKPDDSKPEKEKLDAQGGTDRNPSPNALPEIRRPNLIMPVKSQVLQVEHAVETPDDPRPNAFVDNQHGVCRIYHGPAYGNPYASLYPQRTASGSPLPVGVPHPLKNRYYYGFEPQNGPELGAYPNMPPGFPPIPPLGAQQSFMPFHFVQAPQQQAGQDAAPVPHPSPPNNIVPDRGPASNNLNRTPDRGDGQPQYGFSGIPPVDLLSPRAIAARFSQAPTQSNRSQDKDKGWTTNVVPTPPPGAGGSASFRRQSPNGNRSGGNRNSPANGDGWGGGNSGNSQQASNKTGSGRGLSPNDIGGDGWGGGGWDTQGNKAGTDNGWGKANGWGGSNHSNSAQPDNSGWSPNNNNNNNSNNGWGGSNRGSNSGSNNNNNNNSNNNWGGGSGRNSTRNSPGSERANNMPGAWNYPSNNAGPTSRQVSTGHNSPRTSFNGNQGQGNWGGSASGGDNGWGGGGGGADGWGGGSANNDNNNTGGWGSSGWGDNSAPIPPWGDPSAAQASQPKGGW